MRILRILAEIIYDSLEKRPKQNKIAKVKKEKL